MNKDQKSTLKTALKSLPDNFLDCRDMRHAWTVTQDYFLAEDDNRIIRELACTRCGTFRRDSFRATRDGRLVRFGTSYTYPDTYQLTGVAHGVKPQEVVRGEIYRRTLAHLMAEAVSQ